MDIPEIKATEKHGRLPTKNFGHREVRNSKECNMVEAR